MWIPGFDRPGHMKINVRYYTNVMVKTLVNELHWPPDSLKVKSTVTFVKKIERFLLVMLWQNLQFTVLTRNTYSYQSQCMMQTNSNKTDNTVRSNRRGPDGSHPHMMALVLQLLVDMPVLLLECDGLLTDPDGAEHPDLHRFCLATWRISDKFSLGMEFHHKLQMQSELLIDRRRDIYIMSSGSAFVPGAMDGVKIPFARLLKLR